MVQITDCKALEFYNLTKDKLNNLAKERNISSLDDYYKLTDFNDSTVYGQLLKKLGKNTVNRVFAQMAFHAQNATIISKIVNFESNVVLLEEVLYGFNPKDYLLKYSGKVEDVVEKLRYHNENNPSGLKWNNKKNKTARKDSIITGYAQALIDCARYLKDFNGAEEVLADLKEHYKCANDKKDYINVIEYFNFEMPHRFSIVLTCDFLKEFDVAFSGLCKPDIHIKDTLCALFGHKDGYYNTRKKEYECIGQMQDLVSKINSKLPEEKHITVYKLDRMIWLICSGNFFLHNAKSAKEEYLINIFDLMNA